MSHEHILVMAIFSCFLCFNIQELIVYFQGSLYVFKWHDILLNTNISFKVSSVSYIDSIVSGLVLVFVQSGTSLPCYQSPTNAK